MMRLANKGWTNIKSTQETDPFCYYDIEAEYKGKKFRIECKRRNYESNHFGDSICEEWKYNKFKEDYGKGLIDGALLVSFFSDVFTIDNIFEPFDIDYVWANKTTDFANRKIVRKSMVHYKQARKVNY